VDLVVVSPAVLYKKPQQPEVREAEKKGILVTWEKFLGDFLHKGKKVICVAGTHGKSTTTALAGLLLEKASLDPSVVIGAQVKKWRANYRFGKGEYFVTEADEFYDNFFNYTPQFIVINNIEFDHPDYFSSEEKVIESFAKFVKRLKGEKMLIVNADSPGVKKLLSTLPGKFLKSLRIYGYTFKMKKFRLVKLIKMTIKSKDCKGTTFLLESKDLDLNNIYYLSIPGEYNVANAAGVVILAKFIGINSQVIKKALRSFKGVSRRLELIGEKRGVKLYDDYAHHPTAVKLTIEALRQKHPGNRIWVIYEPHSFSRTKALLKKYKGVFADSDKVIIGPIFKARDKEKFGVSSHSIVKVSGHKDIKFIPSPVQIAYRVKKEVKKGDVVIVMGAGYSYKWAREILGCL